MPLPRLHTWRLALHWKHSQAGRRNSLCQHALAARARKAIGPLCAESLPMGTKCLGLTPGRKSRHRGAPRADFGDSGMTSYRLARRISKSANIAVTLKLNVRTSAHWLQRASTNPKIQGASA